MPAPMWPDEDLLKLLRVRVGLAVDDTGQDAGLSSAWQAATAWVEAYLDRFVKPGDYTEKFVHVRSRALSLRGYAVSSIESIDADADFVPAYHIDNEAGLLCFDGALVAHEVKVTYKCAPPLIGPVMLGLLGAFDATWVAIKATTGGAVGGGGVKSVSSGGARVEFFDASGGGGSVGGVDDGSGLPTAVALMLAPFRREVC